MIEIGQAASNQTALPVTDPFEEMQEVRKWVEDNPDAWGRYMAIAREESRFGTLSPSYVVEILRHRHRISISTNWKPALARIAMEQDGGIRFRLHKSKFDAYTEAVL